MQNKSYNMSFEEKDFNMLTQLDRIEYRQREEIIRRKWIGSIHIMDMFWLFFIVNGFIMLMAVAGYGSVGIHYFIVMMNILLFSIRLFILAFVIAIIVDIYEIIRYRKEIGKLKDSYFKVEIKKR